MKNISMEKKVMSSKPKLKSIVLVVIFILFLSFFFKNVASENSIYYLKIPDNYYYFYLEPKDNLNFPRNTIYVGQPATIFVYLQNTGNTEANGTATVRIIVSCNNTTVFDKNETKDIMLFPRVSEIFPFDLTFNDSKEYAVKAISYILINNKTIKTSEQQISIHPNLVSVTLSTNIPSFFIKVPRLFPNSTKIVGTYTLNLPFENFTIKVLNSTIIENQTKYILTSQDTFNLVPDYKRIKFNETVSNKSYDITFPINLPVSYGTYYNYSIVSKSKTLLPISADVRITFPNGTTSYLKTPYFVWLPSGTYKIESATYQNCNVLPYPSSFDVESPGSKEIILEVDDQIIKVVNNFIGILNFQISNANVSVTFYNGTSKSFYTNASGVVYLSQIPLGKIKSGFVEYKVLGINQKINITNPSDKVVVVNVYLSYPLVTLLSALTLGILIFALVVVLKSKIEKIIFGAPKKETQGI
ncbi:MAG: hypothetical protein QW768_05530 [Thermoproteota archaeon]